ncbi:MAG: tetratricopeptide repeat protein [SAR202 cluster bacterium]|nr:tetratricopeptide repeat protein [SAR202 cluster bacterium]
MTRDGPESGRNPRYSIPEPRGVTLRRPRLLDFLDSNVDRPLQLICAPAGYGKTTLVAEFAAHSQLTACWYSAGEMDRDAQSFLVRLFEAVNHKLPAFDAQFDLAAISQGPDIWSRAVKLFTDRISDSIHEYFLLVVEDFHELTGVPEIVTILDSLVQQLPENCRLIVTSRETPPLPSLPRLVSQQRVVGLGQAELRFTWEEIKELLTTGFGLETSDEDAKRLEQESEGWITAILLMGTPRGQDLFRDVASTRGSKSLVFDYLAAEVFERQPEELKAFLLRTSVLDEFDADLASAVTSVSRPVPVVETIEDKGLFLARLPGDTPWFRYHHLFRDYLRERFMKQDADAFRTAQLDAARALQERGQFEMSIQHYVEAGDFETAATILEERGEQMVTGGRWEPIARVLSQMPVQIRDSRPGIFLLEANWLLSTGRSDDGIRTLNKAIEAFNETGSPEKETKALMLRSRLLRQKGALQMAIRDARQALALAEKNSSASDEAEAHLHLGDVYGQQGRFLRAAKELKLALEKYQGEGDLFHVSLVNEELGTVHVALGDAARAASHFEIARRGWEKLNNRPQLSTTLNNMAVLYHQLGQYDEAESLARQAISLCRMSIVTRDEAYATMTLADILRDKGSLPEALEAYKSAVELAAACMAIPLTTYGAIGLAECYRLSGRIEEARVKAKEAAALAADQGQDYELGLAHISLGILEYEQQRFEDAAKLLARAEELMEASRQKQGAARAKLHLANSWFLARRYTESLPYLKDVAEICQVLGGEQFLAPDASRMPLMIQYAASKGDAKDFFKRLAVQLSHLWMEAKSAPTEVYASPAAIPASPVVEVRALGPLQISLDGRRILNTAWTTAKANEMFLYLLTHRQPLRKDAIVEALWPEIAASKANSNFHSTLYRMKSALYATSVHREGDLYQLNPDWTYKVDSEEFVQLLADAEKAPGKQFQEKEQLLLSALELYRGPFLQTMDAFWCDELRVDLEHKYLTAVAALVREYKARSQTAKAIPLLEKVIQVDELQEDAYYLLADLHLQLNDLPAAGRVIERCRTVLGELQPPVAFPRVGQLLKNMRS